jgi:hypothetical protein
MSPRLLGFFAVFCIVAGMLAFIAWPHNFTHATSAASGSATSGDEIQSKARVFDLPDPHGFTTVGIMAAYEPKSHALWWRPVPFIAEPSMLERYFERCKFQMDGNRLLNFCVRGNEVVVTTSIEYAQSLDQGLESAQLQLQRNPGVVMSYRGPSDSGFNLQQKAGVDMNTPVGVPPTVVRSVRKTASGWELDVTCSCGNALISLNNNLDFAGIQRD